MYQVLTYMHGLFYIDGPKPLDLTGRYIGILGKDSNMEHDDF